MAQFYNGEIDRNKVNFDDKPDAHLHNPTADLLYNFALIADVFEQIESETAEIAEMIFDYLIDVSDNDIMMGTIPPHYNKITNRYIAILNRLFMLSRRKGEKNGIRIINRRTVEDLDKKTYAICMCHDGGVSLDVLCDIVNEENLARTPKTSPVKITVMKAFGREVGRE